MHDQPTDLFTDVSATVLGAPGVEPGTMMGLLCLRVDGAFFASCDRHCGDLIVKLPRKRVQQLIEAGIGKPFTPAGRTFREWVVIDDRDEARWTALLAEAHRFVAE
ncbi:MmcQ/YjbR family DNA-binding protein [Nocardia sp. CNY236]|uniref:MmcQ/YjbR family DNA-binding protein n=1 Tax=Nocardia sp. CNY236 TaxID=1169152 RepID=UPI0006875F73|nr:MmcQ/YjbR family DNA-binding protein [Nocardia sp. CNY236]